MTQEEAASDGNKPKKDVAQKKRKLDDDKKCKKDVAQKEQKKDASD